MGYWSMRENVGVLSPTMFNPIPNPNMTDNGNIVNEFECLRPDIGVSQIEDRSRYSACRGGYMLLQDISFSTRDREDNLSKRFVLYSPCFDGRSRSVY